MRYLTHGGSFCTEVRFMDMEDVGVFPTCTGARVPDVLTKSRVRVEEERELADGETVHVRDRHPAVA